MRPNCTVCSHSDFRFSPCGNFDAFKTPLKIKVKVNLEMRIGKNYKPTLRLYEYECVGHIFFKIF